MARVKKQQRAAARGEWIPSINRPQRYRKPANGRSDPFERAQRAVRELTTRESQARGRLLIRWLSRHAEHLLGEHLLITTLASVPWPACSSRRLSARPLSSPKQLVDRLLMKYPAAPILYAPFGWGRCRGPERLVFARLASHVGGGGSLSQARELGLLPDTCTRRIYRRFLQSSESEPMRAYRLAQAHGVGAPDWAGECVHEKLQWLSRPRKIEQFWRDDLYWRDAIQWLGRHVTDPTVAHTITDYLRACRPALRGRTLASMQRLVEEWHRRLRSPRSRMPLSTDPPYAPSGLGQVNPVAFEQAGWTAAELLTPMALWSEGQAMRHCVWSYRRQVRSRQCSIWSIRLNGARRLTIEVNNSARRVAQVRGVRNRLADAEEGRFFQMWAEANGLRVARR